METIINILITGIAFFIGGKLLSGVELRDFVQCLIVAVVVCVLDFFLGGFLRVITLGLFSLGLFKWILNAIILLVANKFLNGFYVRNFWWALGLAAIVSFASQVMYSLF